MENECNTSNLLLSDVVDRYYMVNFIDKKVYAANFLFIAGLAWNDLFSKTFYATKNVELPVEKDKDGYYIQKPRECVRILSVSREDECGRHPLLINSNIAMSAVSVPKGACKKCDSDLCAVIDSNIVLRTELFDGVEYKLKTYTERLSNGDIIEVVEHMENDTDPTLPPHKVLRRKPLCTLSVYDCGCPKPTKENKELLRTCGCDCLGFTICCNPCDRETVNSQYGYFNFEIDSNKIRLKAAEKTALPKMLILAFQTNGKSKTEELQVPEYGLTTMFDGMKFYSSYKDGPQVRKANELLYESSKLKLAMYLAPFDPVAFRKLQSIIPKWG